VSVAATAGAQQVFAQAEAFLLKRDLAQAHQALMQAHYFGADPDVLSGALWQLYMLSGDFEQAWQQSDALRRRNAPDPHRFWAGEAIAGKRVIVRCLHGFGDAVQMLCYAPHLRAQAAYVTYELPPRLYPLGPYFRGVDDVITWGDQAPAEPPPYDLQLEIMELPYLFRTAVSDLPISTRYLHPPKQPSHFECSEEPQYLAPSTSKPSIGIVWSAGSWNTARSIPFELLQPLFAIRRFEFINLQGKGSAHEAAHLDLPAPADGILPLVATIAELDLVITVDTLAAHLAGALGIPCWLLLQYAADWRWLHARNDSPWYPSLKLFRQPTPGNWAAVVAQVQQCLATLNI
jgi:hypothetical protein